MKLSDIKLSKKQILLIVLNAVLIALAIVCVGAMQQMKNTLYYTGAAKRWAGEGTGRSAYISCFMPVGGELSESNMYSFRSTLETKLTEASFETPETGALYDYAYSGTKRTTLVSPRGSADVKATGIGGDFFFFHPMTLRCGSYISGSDLMHDKIVITEEIAWKLFGAMDVAGMEVTIVDGNYIVAGVIKEDSDFASVEAREENAGVYMAYDKLFDDSENGVSCYEIVLPNGITSFGKNLVAENFPSKECTIVEVSDRYSLGNIFDVLLSFGKRSMRTDGIVFPYWENAARLTEDYSAAALFFCAALLVTPLVFGSILAYRYGKKYGAKLSEKTKEKAVELYDKANDKLYEKEQRERR